MNDDPARAANVPGWRRALVRCDGVVVSGTRVALFGIGATFTVLIALEVASRYLFSFSIYQINALARFALVWFFVLGAGLALREGAHVGLELFVDRMPARPRRLLGHFVSGLVLAFFVLMVVSGVMTLPSAMNQYESALGVSRIWVMAAFPVGFALLAYHQVCLALGIALRKTTDEL